MVSAVDTESTRLVDAGADIFVQRLEANVEEEEGREEGRKKE